MAQSLLPVDLGCRFVDIVLGFAQTFVAISRVAEKGFPHQRMGVACQASCRLLHRISVLHAKQQAYGHTNVKPSRRMLADAK
jgi:hypothetical protein